MSSRIITRRELLRYSVAAGGSLIAGVAAAASPTVEQVMGPFYPVARPYDEDADLTFVRGRRGRAAGQVINLSGRVLDAKGKPVRGAVVEIWQANTHGRYDHKSDTNTSVPTDPAFQGYSQVRTDVLGRFAFKTIKPGAYPAAPTWTRTPHIHFDVRGKVDRLVTQLYFADEPLNETDLIYQALTVEEQAGCTVELTSSFKDASSLDAAFDIVLATG
ncbi:MAG TPA: protocatechuate 3,4-dioxygenase [Pinirhizobacter sp.]|uniref:protocatechuate 3,4-dioxygenase n=1 Tax=Pinirhizobacter sp. TaxID=2950432 RepID=UPI002C866298|nr:protocatechuate 3,4-dioxygenase [Pinirhizobacter sp.]HMH67610.1 protocatechuate 3,4-dioxygenase [Pinirhizobacter sp.]